MSFIVTFRELARAQEEKVKKNSQSWALISGYIFCTAKSFTKRINDEKLTILDS